MVLSLPTSCYLPFQFKLCLEFFNFSHEGRTWFTPHRGRLWIASTAKKPSQEDIEHVEKFYKHLKGGNVKI